MLARSRNILDALTQLGNVLLLPDAEGTNANESISGRCYRLGVLEGRLGWYRLMTFIDALMFWEIHHCEVSYLADVSRAARLMAYHKGWK